MLIKKNMKYSKLLLSIAISLIINNLSSAQNVMYQWRTHLAYTNTSQIAVTKNKVYAISEGALFSVHRNDKNIEIYSKINGLSDNNVIRIAYSQKQGELLIAYDNGNIDFINDNGQILNLPDIYRANITADKTLNDVLFDGDYAYLSYTFGIVKLSLRNMEISDTYYIGENGSFVDVKSVSILDNYFYAVTDNKIYKALASSNLVNYANWQILSDVPNPSVKNVKAIAYESKLYLLKSNKKMHIFYDDLWNDYVDANITNICTNDDVLFIIADKEVKYIKGTVQSVTFDSSVSMAIYDGSISKIWAAAGNPGIVLSNLTAIEDSFKPDGPAKNNFWRLKHAYGRIYGVSGGRPDYYSGLGTANAPGYVMIYEKNDSGEEGWTNISPNSAGGNGLDLLDIAIYKNDKKHYYVASYSSGIYEFKDDKPFMLYNTGNSGIGRSTVDALYFDKNSRLWFAVSLLQYYNPAAATIKYLEPDPDGAGPLLGKVIDVFYNETAGQYSLAPVQIIPSPNDENLKFMLNVRGTNAKGIFAFNDNGTPDDMSDDPKPAYYTIFTDKDGKTFSHNDSKNMCAAQDKTNNTIWVGGTFGTMILDNFQNILNKDSYRVTRVKISRNDGSGLADYLLENEQVNAIAIDGGNRKWIGTAYSGVYLMSEDGTKTIHHFKAENSPLLSNNIISIAINDKTGEVFFATDKGLISFQSDAIPPEDSPEIKLHAYPNPVRPEHIAQGIPVTITGIKDNNTIVKIVDAAGNLVYEATSKGGMVTWDCKRRGGKTVSTGVYIAICVSKDGKHHATTKILIVN